MTKQEKHKRYYEKNREKLIQKSLKYNAEHPDKIRANNRKYHEKNKETLIPKIIAWQKKNPEKVKEKAKRYYQKNKEKLNAKSLAKYHEKHPNARHFKI